MGGKDHICCQCRGFPLLPTNKTLKKKARCKWKCCIQADGSQVDYSHCKRYEAFVCSNPFCSLRVCKQCYMKFSKDTVHKIYPENRSDDDEYEEDVASVNTDCDENVDTNSIESEQDENDSEESDGEETDADTVEKYDDIQDTMERFVVRSTLDTTLDITGDNNNLDTGIIGTNSGDIAENVSDGSEHYRVLGHVIFNQVGSCLSCWKKEYIVGNSVQKF